MGAQFCSGAKGVNVFLSSIDMKEAENMPVPEVNGFQEAVYEGLPQAEGTGLGGGGSSSSSFPEWRSTSRFDMSHHLEIAQMIADDRKCRGFASAALIEEHFDLKRPGFHDPPSSCLAVHKTTGMTRRLVQVLKPTGAEQQERLRTFIRKTQSLQCENVARILEVFEDWRTIGIVMEHCTGGSIYDRILKLPRLCTPSPYFAEQESAVIVRHALQSLSALHQSGLSHGHPTPESFHFQSVKTHASMKLVDFGLELKVHAWDAAHSAGFRGPYDRGRATCLQFYEPCRVVFCAPEVVRPLQPKHRRRLLAAASGGQADQDSASTSLAHAAAAATSDDGQPDLLSEIIDSHLDSLEEHDARRLEAADAWSIGAIAFVLLCGYPPFFAPCRYAILSRIDRTDFAFDPPFWSKVSEEAKDFVQRCLRAEPCERMSVAEALAHPWIQCLADTSPSGPMLPSFALNLRRFVRTALIEKTTANTLACKLSFAELQDFAVECRHYDVGASGFFTATELRQVLIGLGHNEVAENIAMCFSRALRHPGESYIDYVTLVDSVRARRERLLEEELWKCFCEFAGVDTEAEVCSTEAAGVGQLPLSRLGTFLGRPDVGEALLSHGVDDAKLLADSVYHSVRPTGPEAPQAPALQVDFLEVSSEVLRNLPQITAGIPVATSQPVTVSGAGDSEPGSPSASPRSPTRGDAVAPASQGRARSNTGDSRTASPVSRADGSGKQLRGVAVRDEEAPPSPEAVAEAKRLAADAAAAAFAQDARPRVPRTI